ncbi:GspE/PulE family protein [Noviherbaspirillum malthae]|uniref:GspE/PulE family protein n=1 Tax=Noviherbaspirillum malthae TaxID=1260987 RepID=UPI00188F63DD|nr:GspE/PulE family protein [Noviherbaspirillum malthae]
MIEKLTGQRVSAMLITLDLASAAIEVTGLQGAEHTRIDFTALRSLRLPHAVELRRVGLQDKVDGMAFSDAQTVVQREKCVVELTGGQQVATDVMGYIPHAVGLFLYMVHYGNHALRVFYPAHAVSHYQVGEKIGQLLVQQQIVSADSVAQGLKQQQALRTQRLGDYLQQNDIITHEQVEAALDKQRRMPQIRLGDALVQEGVISEKQLKDALTMQSHDRKQQLGSILMGMGVITKEVLNRVLAQKLGIPFVYLDRFRFDPEVLKAVPAALAKRYQVIPLCRSESRLAIATDNPLAAEPLQELGFVTRMRVEPVMASTADLKAAIARYYGADGELENLTALVQELNGGTSAAKPTAADTSEVVTESDNTLVRLVNKVILDAYKTGASDIHIEAGKGNKPTRIRFRKDGVMVPYSEVPSGYRSALISRLKIMAVLDISEKRHPQDGKINFATYSTVPIELRVATIPTQDGLEDVVMRILAQPLALPPDQLDIAPVTLDRLKALAVKPYGLLLVCGPTGSGKTTTLHSLLSYINTPERKIWTVEDPVEISQEGLRQVQVQNKIGWTFPAVLRTFLRADPDVIMVGETRDTETAKTIIEASLTGHLVLSTLHTNSAVESILRLLDLGMDPFNFSDALLGILGQRLARRLCRVCRIPYLAMDDELDMMAAMYAAETNADAQEVKRSWQRSYANTDDQIRLYRACGCPQCSQTGYKGRIGVFELLINSPAIKRKIYLKSSIPELLAVAVAEGFKTIRQDGIEKVLNGETDLKQVQQV